MYEIIKQVSILINVLAANHDSNCCSDYSLYFDDYDHKCFGISELTVNPHAQKRRRKHDPKCQPEKLYIHFALNTS